MASQQREIEPSVLPTQRRELQSPPRSGDSRDPGAKTSRHSPRAARRDESPAPADIKSETGLGFRHAADTLNRAPNRNAADDTVLSARGRRIALMTYRARVPRVVRSTSALPAGAKVDSVTPFFAPNTRFQRGAMPVAERAQKRCWPVVFLPVCHWRNRPGDQLFHRCRNRRGYSAHRGFR